MITTTHNFKKNMISTTKIDEHTLDSLFKILDPENKRGLLPIFF